MRRRTLALVAVTALAVTACGTRVDPSVFEELTAGRTEGASAPLSQGDEPGGDRGADAPGAAAASGPATAAGTGDASGSGPSGGPGVAGGDAGNAAGDTTGADGGTSTGGTGAARDDPANGASDVGVAADRILVGNVTTKGGPLGPNQFTPMLQGAKAYFARLNAEGGIHGRRVELLTCDDKADPDRNRQCVRDLVENQGVFAFVANSTRAYAGARIVSDAGVPDIGGQPIGNEYFQFPTLYSVRGAEYDRDGEVGHRGQLYNGTAIFRYLAQELGVQHAAVFYYDIPQSKAYGVFLAKAMRAEGYEVTEYEVNPAFPSFDSYVADMRAKGIEVIFDSMDLTGNQNLCRSMERNDFGVDAKVGLVSSWSQRVRDQFPEICKRSLLAWGESTPYSTQTPELETFRQTMRDVYGGEFDGALHQWHVEGWIAAKTFTEGVRRLGAEVTRAGLMAWLDTFTPGQGYGADGLIVPQSWRPFAYDDVEEVEECVTVARWSVEAEDFLPVQGGRPVCFRVPLVAWDPAA